MLVNPEVLDGHHSDPEESDDDALPVEQIEADEGELLAAFGIPGTANCDADLTADMEDDTDVRYLILPSQYSN